MSWLGFFRQPDLILTGMLGLTLLGLISGLKLVLSFRRIQPLLSSVSAWMMATIFILVSLWTQTELVSLKPWLVVGICILGSWQLSRVVTALIRHTALIQKSPLNPTYIPLMVAGLRITLGITIGLLILDAFGVNVLSLVAGLGISGVIVALAIQSILGDVFTTITLSLDQSLKPGDFINVGTQSGKLESIGLKMSRVKSLSGEMVLIPNQQLVSEPIQNFRNISTRRVVIELLLPHSTPSNTLTSLPSALFKKLETIDSLTIDRVHVSSISTHGIGLEIVAHIKAADYTSFMDSKQAMILSIKSFLESKQITLLYQPSSVSLLSADPA